MNKARALEAWRLRHDGLTFKEIGRHLKSPVSPSRARQLFIQGCRIADRWLAKDINDGYTLGSHIQSIVAFGPCKHEWFDATKLDKKGTKICRKCGELERMIK